MKPKIVKIPCEFGDVIITVRIRKHRKKYYTELIFSLPTGMSQNALWEFKMKHEEFIQNLKECHKSTSEK